MDCYLCKSPAMEHAGAPHSKVSCVRCGDYTLSSEARVVIENTPLTAEASANVSGYLRENPGFKITYRDLPFLRNLRTPTVPEKAMKALLALARLYPEPGEEIFLDGNTIGALCNIGAMAFDQNPDAMKNVPPSVAVMGYCWAKSGQEVDFLLMEYLLKEDWLSQDSGPPYYQISPIGWQVIAENQRGVVESNRAFVAMAFDASLTTLYQYGLHPGIRAAGYDPFRVDGVEHNNKIDDEIIVRIKECKFLVADCTINRGGIYFEAGFAMGLDRRVIWTCRKDTLKDVHFDTRQYNFIRWEPDKFSDLATALENRIVATIGRGPLTG